MFRYARNTSGRFCRLAPVRPEWRPNASSSSDRSGPKEGIDFDRVEETLIQPAIRGVKGAVLEGSTTVPIVEQGNIREDMFRELVIADIVIADLSIHNANVFYELGIRHGLRPHATFLLRADASKFPFDLQTDRYLRYDAAQPETALQKLTAALEKTVASARIDSPVYRLLPNLRAPDADVLNVVPREFADTVDVAQAAGHRADLRLLAHESRGFSWAPQGLRLVGRAQFAIDAWSGASETFEWLREIRPDDIEANQRLGTLYQRLATDANRPDGYLAPSTAAIQRVIDSPSPTGWDIAEAWALKARNVKAQWFNRLRGRPVDEARRDALALPELDEALETYYIGFTHNLNHFYSGLNALVLLRIRLDLARLMPEAWAARVSSRSKPSPNSRRWMLGFSGWPAPYSSPSTPAAWRWHARLTPTSIAVVGPKSALPIRRCDRGAPGGGRAAVPAGPFWRSCVCSGRRPRTAEDLPDTGTAAALRGRRAWRPGAAGGAGGMYRLSGPTACCSSRATWSMRRDARNRASRPRPRPRRAG